MRVVLTTELFARSVRSLDILALFQMAMEGVSGRHRIEVEDELAKSYEDWLSHRSVEEQEACKQSLRASLSESSLCPSSVSIWVSGSDSSDWSLKEPRLSLQDALILLGRPLSILVENKRNDRAFLRCFLDPNQLKLVDEHERRGWLVFEHGGGLPEMIQIVRDVIKPTDWSRLRYYVVSDSDALRPGEPSPKAKELRGVCGQKIHYRMLKRRNIENYLPRQTVEHWATEGSATERARKQAKVEALFRLSEPQRHHYNFKKGFAGDVDLAEAGRTAGDLYDLVPLSDRTELNTAFGSAIAKQFGEVGKVHESALRLDGSWAEMEPVVADLLAFLR